MTKEVSEKPDDDGLGGDEPFCDHGNLLWSEDCDECADALWSILAMNEPEKS